LPDFVGPDPALKEVLEGVHETFTKILLVVAGIHIFAALKHALLDRDGALGRISSTVSIVVFVAVIGVGVLGLTRTGSFDIASGEAAGAQIAAEAPAASELPLWKIDHAASHIRFTAEHPGADFDGEWLLWSADLRFAGDQLRSSSFDVNIIVTAVETHDDARDQTLQDEEWFDSANFPEVIYRADRFSAATDGNWIAQGYLTIKGQCVPAELTFSVREEHGRSILDGTAVLDRLALQVGTGDRADPTWAGQTVTVSVHVEATVSE
jgi:cytochrome b561